MLRINTIHVVCFIYKKQLVMNQSALIEFLSQGLIDTIEVYETSPSKGKSLNKDKDIWILVFILSNGNRKTLLSSRGTQREWASLDTLNDWLKNNGISTYQIFHKKG